MKVWAVVSLVAGCLISFGIPAYGQSYVIKPIAGGALPVNGPGSSTSLGNVYGATVVDSGGNVFIAASDYHIVLRLDAKSGMLTLVAGTGTAGFSGDKGPATSAMLGSPWGLAIDSAGNIYIADSGNERIRMISNGVITTVAGIGGGGFGGDNGPATNAQLNAPTGVGVDNAGNLYIADAGNHRVRKISQGVITTVAGTGVQGFSGDNGPAASTQLSNPSAVALDSAGNLYIADGGNQRIRKVSNGVITTVAGNGIGGFSGDNGPSISAQLNGPGGVAIDFAGSLYIADTSNNRIRKVSNGVITTDAGSGELSFGGDNGAATSAQLSAPRGVAVDSTGSLFITDSYNYRIRKVSKGIITTIAGNGTGSIGDSGPATSAQLSGPMGVAIDFAGNLYIADSSDNRIRKVSNGVITTAAGIGTCCFGADNGPAISAHLIWPNDVAVSSGGDLFIADSSNSLIRKVSNGIITTVAGNGNFGFSGDNGPATSAQLGIPEGIAVDSSGNLYIADTWTHRIRRVSNGVISTVAGNGNQGFSGDGGLATSAQFNEPLGIAVDSSGNLFIADAQNERVRKVSNGIITTVAGAGIRGFSGDGGPATNAQLNHPWRVVLDLSGNLYIAESDHIRRVSGGVITTIAGGGATLGDNGPATSAQFSAPAGLTMDISGNIYVADYGSNRVRVLIPSGPPCAYTVNPSHLTATSSAGSVSATIQTSSACAWAIQSLPDWITTSGSALGSGSSTVTLAVASNSGPARTAIISISGVSVSLQQQGAGTGSCTYSISPTDQSYPATGGTGTITIATQAGCTWSVTNSLSWVTLTSSTSGTGGGTVNFSVPANTGATRSGSITVAGKTFTVEQVGSTTSFTSQALFPHFASGGGWNTRLLLLNTSQSPIVARVSFFANAGTPVALPLNLPQTSGTAPLLASTLERTLAGGATLVIDTASADPLSQTGWVQVLSTGTVAGYDNFRSTTSNGFREVFLPLQSASANTLLLPFDHTNDYGTGIAVANSSTASSSVGVTIRDDSGNMILTTTVQVPIQGHKSFDLAADYPAAAGIRGTIEFDGPGSGGIGALGVRYGANHEIAAVVPVVK